MNDRRVEITNLNHVHISLLKKSVAPSISMWMRMNSRQVMVFFRSGAGGMPWRLRMLPTVWSLIV
jgi:hypothetical protein